MTNNIFRPSVWIWIFLWIFLDFRPWTINFPQNYNFWQMMIVNMRCENVYTLIHFTPLLIEQSKGWERLAYHLTNLLLTDPTLDIINSIIIITFTIFIYSTIDPSPTLVLFARNICHHLYTSVSWLEFHELDKIIWAKTTDEVPLWRWRRLFPLDSFDKVHIVVLVSGPETR